MNEWGGLSRGGAPIGLGFYTPGDVLSYRATWNQYVLDTYGSAYSCANEYAAIAAQDSDATTKALLVDLSNTRKQRADTLLALWNQYANKDSSFIVLQGASMLQTFQQTVISASQFRDDIVSGKWPCSLSYVDSDGQLVHAIPAADPSVQAQVIARIEGLGILAAGILQILVTSGGNALIVAGTATQELAKDASKVASALSTPWPWIAITAAAAGYVIYEVWPKGRS